MTSRRSEGGEQAAGPFESSGGLLDASIFDSAFSKSLRSRLSRYWQGVVGWAEDLEMAQKILLTLLVLASSYMLIFYAGLFFALLLMLGLVFTVAWFRSEHFRGIAAAIQRHQVLSGVCLLLIVCSTPILVPAIVNFLAVAAAVMLIVAVVISIGALLVGVVMYLNEAEKEHNRWYNSLSESEKQTYQLKRQTQLMEEQNRRARQAEWDRKMRRKGY